MAFFQLPSNSNKSHTLNSSSLAKRVSLPKQDSLSDEEFVQNINSIIRRKNYNALIDRQSEMSIDAQRVRICLDVSGFHPSELQVRLSCDHVKSAVKQKTHVDTKDGVNGTKGSKCTWMRKLPFAQIQQQTLDTKVSNKYQQTKQQRLEVHGEHLEYHSHKLAIRKQLVRCYILPDNASTNAIRCTFSKRGTLKIEVPLTVEDEEQMVENTCPQILADTYEQECGKVYGEPARARLQRHIHEEMSKEPKVKELM